MKVKEETNWVQDLKEVIVLSFGEELGNSVSHGVAAVALIISLPYVGIKTYLDGGTTYATVASIFVVSLILMYLGSTIYHIMAHNTLHKAVMRKVDHSMIFVAIAGSYTPIAFMALDDHWSYITVIVQWLVAVYGIVYKSIVTKGSHKLSLLVYLTMGWMAIFLMPMIIMNTSLIFVLFIVLGGLGYTIGAIFYAHKKPWFHFIWHLFIVFASICHFIAIVFYL
ncbi:PAQR family membrane homeostasis protein TrhA [Abyssicoccus albus]|uniref:PAQR family membrane homeostasis protein TrhA n=1 Tax=Abyssicoccus albus TaxID=1817405 RepID=UPI00097E181C|nr:hemolysin III family protein [Abyssicoccus albus]AQL56789.1 hemolysin III [Abyssicoccus albus]